MGAERYCVACGGPTHCPKYAFNPTHVKKIITQVKKVLSKKQRDNFVVRSNDLFSDSYATQSEFLRHFQKEFTFKDNFPEKMFQDAWRNKISLNIKPYAWLRKVVVLHKDGRKVNIVSADTWQGEYVDRAGRTYNVFFPFTDDVKKYTSPQKKKILAAFDPRSSSFYGDGYVIHKACFDLLKKTHPRLSFTDFYLKQVNYKSIAPYQRQDIPWLSYFMNKKSFMLENPVHNAKNRKRIQSIKLPIKKAPKVATGRKIKETRPSPSVSATTMKKGQVKTGNDGGKWKVVVNKNGVKRWSRV